MGTRQIQDGLLNLLVAGIADFVNSKLSGVQLKKTLSADLGSLHLGCTYRVKTLKCNFFILFFAPVVLLHCSFLSKCEAF